MSNAGIDVWASFARWVPRQIGTAQDILVAMDWTDFDHRRRPDALRTAIATALVCPTRTTSCFPRVTPV